MTLVPRNSDDPLADPSGARFPATMWSMVLEAGQGDGTGQDSRRRESLTELCRIYWYPVYGWLRRHGQSPHDAQDLTQGFFAHLLRNDRLGTVGPELGRFRSFILASLRNYLCDQHDKAAALKRGGGVADLSIDAAAVEHRYQLEPANGADPSRLFDRNWALALLQRVLSRLEDDQDSEVQRARFSALEPFLLGEAADHTQSEAAARLGMSDGAFKVALLRLRQRYRELFRQEVAQTLRDRDDLDEEMAHVLAILSEA
jgi:RNA polymerase sigma-70 factor (ECF subfamily)